MFWNNPLLSNQDDETERMISELQYGPLPQQLRKVSPVHGCRLTEPQRRVLAKIDGMRLPFISKPLVYAREIDRLPARERKTVLALLYGRAIRVVRERGPLPGEHERYEIGASAPYHYKIEAVC
jgi:hypothetical protein